MWNITRTMSPSAPASHPDIDEPPAPLSSEELEAERLETQGWPAFRGTPAQRDARFANRLLKAQLALLRARK
jgi:hypothetical protein